MLWLVVITLESTSVFTGETTENWLGTLLRHFGTFSRHDLDIINHVLRKTGHFTGYALLSWFAFRGWMETLAYQLESALERAGKRVSAPRRWHARAAALAVLCTIVVAGLDEFHQSFIPGRTGVFRDVVLDTMGGIFAQCALLLYWTRGKRRGQRQAGRQERFSTVATDEI